MFIAAKMWPFFKNQGSIGIFLDMFDSCGIVVVLVSNSSVVL